MDKKEKEFREKLKVEKKSPDIVDKTLLEVFPYEYSDKRDVEIHIEHYEFSSVCPMTGLPDFGTLKIKYIPDKYVLELKSLKYYLLQYRQVGIFYEHLVNKILDDLVSVCSPKYMEIKGEFNPRGGMKTTVFVCYKKGEKK